MRGSTRGVGVHARARDNGTGGTGNRSGQGDPRLTYDDKGTTVDTVVWVRCTTVLRVGRVHWRQKLE